MRIRDFCQQFVVVQNSPKETFQMGYQHDAQLANIVTSYCTCLGGIIPLLFTALTRSQPRRWVLVYGCILLTGIPTVWMHSVEGNHLASFFDVGTNITLAWALIVGVAGDFLLPESRRKLLLIVTPVNLLVLLWLFLEISLVPKRPIISFGEFGQFYAGEVALIVNAWVVALVFLRNAAKLPRDARPLLYATVALFFIGMVLASASNREITWRILPWHAAWHVVGMFGFITMWLFNDVRFNRQGLVARVDGATDSVQSRCAGQC